MFGKYMDYSTLIKKIDENKPLYLGIEIIRPLNDDIIKLDDNNILRLFGTREDHLSYEMLQKLAYTNFCNVNKPKRIVRANSGEVLGYTISANQINKCCEETPMKEVYRELKNLKFDLQILGRYGIRIGCIDNFIDGYNITDINSFKYTTINTVTENLSIYTDYYLRHMDNMSVEDFNFFMMNYINSESMYIADYFDKLDLEDYTKKSFEENYRKVHRK